MSGRCERASWIWIEGREGEIERHRKKEEEVGIDEMVSGMKERMRLFISNTQKC